MNRRRRSRRGAWAILGWLALSGPLLALNPARPADSYSVRGWFTEHGLPSNKIRAVTQTRDGYLWIATAQGIARFDGARFTTFTGATDPELRGGGFFAVLEAADGTLWFGGDQGLFRWQGGGFERFTTAHGLADNYVRTLAPTRDGGVAVCTRRGVSFVRDGKIATPNGIWRQPTVTARAYQERLDGSIYLGTDDGLWRAKDGTVERVLNAAGERGGGFTSLLETPDGSFWVGHQAGVRRVRPDGTEENFGVAEGLTAPRVSSLWRDRDGNVWVASLSGLYRLAAGKIEPATTAGDAGGITTIQQLYEDREGALWVASAVGLFRVQDNVASTIGIAEGLAQTSVFAVKEARDGAWWIGLWGGGVYRYQQGRATRLPVPAGMNLDQILAFAEDGDGAMWVGSVSGLFRHYEGRLEAFYDAAKAGARQKQLAANPGMTLPGLAHGRVNSIAADGTGGVWVATDGALYHGRDGSFRMVGGVDGLPGSGFKSVLRASNGDVWVSVPPFGVGRWREGKWTSYRTGEELSSVYPRFVYEDSSGTIWVATDGGGLNRFQQERWRTFRAKDGLADEFISGLVEDRRGNLWIGFPRGIMRIPQSEFTEMVQGQRARLQPQIFDRSDGLPAAEGNQQGAPAAAPTRDGRLLFATDRGVAVVEAEGVTRETRPPAAHIERLRVDGVDADLARDVVLPPGGNTLEVQYTAISLRAAEKVRFRIRLDPLDRDWVETTRRDVRYDKLPPGEYEFRVIAANGHGEWSGEERKVAFTVEPYFYQTGWFASLLLAAAVGGVAGVFRMRARLARRQMEQLERVVEQRTQELKVAKEAAEAAVAEHRRAEVELRLKTALLEAQTDSSPDGILIVNTTGRRLFQNARFLELWRIPREIAANPDCEVQKEYVRRQPKDRAAYVRKVEHLYAHPEETSRDEVELKDGTLLDRYSSPIRGRDGTLYGRVWTVRDITEQKRAHTALANSFSLLHATLESTADGVLVVDLAGRHVTHNQKFAAMWRVASEILQASNAVLALRRAMAQLKEPRRFIAKVQALHRQPDVESVDVLEFTDGRVFELYSMPQRVHGETVGRVWNFRDITERRRAETELKVAHGRLLDASRQAGMAEVATGVLHNVGNVLNSVNVSASLIADGVRHSKIDRVAKLAELFEAHAASLGEFLTSDARGRQVPSYLQSLAGQLEAERQKLLGEVDALRKNVEHIKGIVAMQQNYAKVAGVVESVAIVELIEDALRMNPVGIAGGKIGLTCDFEAQPLVTTEKHKVLQILVNLLQNARHACEESGRRDPQIVVRVTADPGAARVAVSDNGVGIARENLTRIFAHGFTTKKNGHGFGLHSGALAAREVGGALAVQSEGLGKGATFVLTLPTSRAAKAA